MVFARRKQRPAARALPVTKRDELAYALLEEARLMTEQLRAHTDSPKRRAELHSLQREIGLAGFAASARLPSSTRRATLALVHRRQQAQPRSLATMHRLAEVLESGRAAVERALTVPGLSDHIHLARGHADAAQELLDSLRRGRRISPRRVEARRPLL